MIIIYLNLYDMFCQEHWKVEAEESNDIGKPSFFLQDMRTFSPELEESSRFKKDPIIVVLGT